MDDHSDDIATTPGVPRYVALLLLALAIGAGALAIFFAAEAAEAAADADLLKDGVDRSRLSREEAVAIARLALERSTPVPESELADHDHDHGSGPARELTPAEQELFDEQWAAATDSVPKFDTIAEVEAAGYVLASGNSDGAGVHYVKWSIVDRPFDPAEPSMLLFEELKRGEEMELIAYSYWVSSDGPPDGFVGEEDSWHRHLGVCFVNGYIKDEHVLREQCPGDWINGMDLWMLHAWVVPGLENDYGRFHNVNPLLCERACGLED
ncbi:MAG: hypothetical protein QNJ77_15070 [Acidimicrobiia bacterium]|nr:hypothetical protein [Acidimicrobiia bacterium]